MAKLIALVLPLGLDTFTVAAALGMAGLPERHRLRISLLFTAFEGGMPIIGLALGAPLGSAIGSSADYIAIAVLRALHPARSRRRGDRRDREPHRTRRAGHTAARPQHQHRRARDRVPSRLLRVPAIAVLIAIAAQAFVVTQLGLRLGTRLSHRA